MGCRPSRNSLGRVADSTSEYNRCYIKELDKARRKQKKSTRGGRRRTPTYNAFSSTTRCYERDKGASKITVRLSTDGSMLEIEQYDIEYTPVDDFISESTNEDRGIEMKPISGESTSFDRCRKTKFLYGRCDSAPLLKTDITGSNRAAGFQGDSQESNSPCFSVDSISFATSHDNYVSKKSSSIVAVNVHKEITEHIPCDEGDKHDLANVVCDSTNPDSGENLEIASGGLYQLSVGLDNNYHRESTTSIPKTYSRDEFRSFPDTDRQNISSKRTESKQLIPNGQQDISKEGPTPGLHDSNTDVFQSCVYRIEGCDLQNFPIQTENTICYNCAKINASCRGYEHFNGDRRDSSTLESALPQNNSCLSEESEMDNSKKVCKNKRNIKQQINKTGNRQELTENQKASDRLFHYCYVCEKDKWNNTKPLCAYINNKCQPFVSSELRDCGTDSNANVSCCRRHASKLRSKSSPVLKTEHAHGVYFDDEYKNRVQDKSLSFSQDGKTGKNISLTDHTVGYSSKLSFHHETIRNNPRKEANLITTDIDFSEKKLCHDLLGQQTLPSNKPAAFFSDNAQHLQCSEKSMCAHTLNEHLENLCPEKVKNYICIGRTCNARETTEIKIDKFKSVTMVTNDVSETAFRNDDQLRCDHHISTIEESEISANGDKHSCKNECIDSVDDDIYHDVCGCQRGTYVTTASQCDRYSDILTESPANTSKNNEKTRSICNIGCCNGIDIVTDDIWRHKHIDVKTNDCHNDDYDIDDSDSSDDYRDDEYVDAMETTYV